MLKEMVKEVNATQVAPEERLTDEVYHYDMKDHVFEKADRFTERQKEKAAQAVTTKNVGISLDSCNVSCSISRSSGVSMRIFFLYISSINAPILDTSGGMTCGELFIAS